MYEIEYLRLLLSIPIGIDILASSGVSVASSTISSIDVLGEDLTAQKFGRLYRRWLKFTNRTMKQYPRQVIRDYHYMKRTVRF